MRKSETCLSDKCETFLSHRRYISALEFGGTERLITVLDTLTKSQKQIVFLCLINKLSVAEIAKELSISEQAVYSRLHNAFKRLKQNTEYIIT